MKGYPKAEELFGVEKRSIPEAMTDFTQLSRTEWINLFENFNADLFDSVAGFTDHEWNRRSPYVGWRVRDVLVNITRAKVVNFHQLLDRALNDNEVAPKEFDTFLRGEREIMQYRDMPVHRLLDAFMLESERLMDRYRQMSDEEFMKPGWFFVGPMNVRGLLLTEFGDNVFHLRDMLQPNGKWQGLDASYTNPLTDWFMREYRPAHFRAEQAEGVTASILYRLSGVGGGAWTMIIEGQKCKVVKGIRQGYDVVIAADVEDLVALSLARSGTWPGGLVRGWQRFIGSQRQTDTVARILHYLAFLDAMINRKVRFGGDKKLGISINRKCFWHFYERTQMTSERIHRSRSMIQKVKV
ncbi:MAG: maleylpyruvate isomerase N-terminal domain-containing protein [Flavobacteriales bacterium]|nr:maleylpyruvate isomerase N-terminal domain-containing protein [Flavobacteriales bacterium]